MGASGAPRRAPSARTLSSPRRTSRLAAETRKGSRYHLPLAGFFGGTPPRFLGWGWSVGEWGGGFGHVGGFVPGAVDERGTEGGGGIPRARCGKGDGEEEAEEAVGICK